MSFVNLYPQKISYAKEEGGFEVFDLKEVDKFLWSVVDVHHSVTIRTFFDIFLSQDIYFWQRVLMEPYVKDLVEFYKDHIPSKTIPKFDSVLFTWGAVCWKDDDDSDFDDSLDVSGYRKNDPENPSGIYGLTFTPLIELIDCPIVIDKKFEVSVVGCGADKRTTIDLGNKIPTLIELLRAFVFELTFAGNENQKKEKLNQLQDMMQDFENNYKDDIEDDTEDDTED